MILKLKRTPGIYLVGFMGCGKSTVGKALAYEIGWTFADLDDDIERRERMKISEIFDTRGEADFRQAETNALRERVRAIQSGRPHVLALGGGAFAQSQNRELVADHGVSVWIDCPLARIEERVAKETHRPLARNLDKMRALYAHRLASYSQAEYRIPHDSDDPSEAVARVLALKLL